MKPLSFEEAKYAFEIGCLFGLGFQVAEILFKILGLLARRVLK
jgi:hypothetical protein